MTSHVSVFLECPKIVHGKSAKFIFFVTKGTFYFLDACKIFQ